VNLGIIQEMFQDDYTLLLAESGETALSCLKNFKPDLVLLDIMMPKMNGYEVCHKIRKDKIHKFVKIILVSGKTSLEERLEGYEAGADDYVTKPFEIDELEAKVETFLKLKYTEEVDQVKSNIMRLFSHESRTPLNGIIGPAQLLLEMKDLDKDAKLLIGMIMESSNKLYDFVKKSTLYCELKAISGLGQWDDSLNTHIEKTLSSLEKRIDDRGVKIIFSPAKSYSVWADWVYFEKVLEYILDNAVKYSPKNGTVTVELGESESHSYIIVRDEGSGIEPEKIEVIFEEFEVSDILSHKSGSCLSLAVARLIMELHDGKIEIISKKDIGTDVIISLPRKEIDRRRFHEN